MQSFTILYAFWDFCAEQVFDRSPGWSWPSLPPKLFHCWSIEGKPFQVSSWERNHLKLKRCIAPDQPLYSSRITSWDRERGRERESFCAFLQIQGFTVAINSTDSKMSKTLSHHKQHVITITCSWQTRIKTCCGLSEMHGKSTEADISWPCATSKSSQIS